MKRTLRSRPALLAALTLSFALLVAGSVSVGAASGPRSGHRELRSLERHSDDLLCVRRHAARPRRQVREAGRHADHGRPHEARRHGQERPPAGLPAEHRRRLVHARHRHLARRARLDEQHVPPDRRGQLQQLDELRHDRHPPGRPHRPGGRAGRQDRGLDGVGRHAEPRSGAPGPGRRLPHLHRRPRHRPQLRPPRPAGRRERLRRRSTSASTWRTRPAGRTSRRRSARRSRRRSRTTTRRSPAQRGLGRLHLRLDATTARPTTTASWSSRPPTARTAPRRSRTWRRASGPTSR